MSGATVVVFFGEPVEREDFLGEIVALGGVLHPRRFSDATVGEGSRGMWIGYRRGGEMDLNYETKDLEYAKDRLGGPIGALAIVTGTKGRESELLMLEVIEGLARRWRLMVDRDAGDSFPDQLVTVGQLRNRVAAGLLPFDG